MGNVNILASTEIKGEEVLPQARAAVREFQALGVKVPKMEIKGDWKMNGFDFSFDEWVDAYPPLGNKYLKAGERKAQVEPTADSEMRIFFVFSGEGITDSNPLSKGDLFAVETPDEEETDAE